MSKKTRATVRHWTEHVMRGAQPGAVVEAFVSMLEDLRVGPLVDTAKAEIAAGRLKPNAKDVAEFLAVNFPHLNQLRIDIAVKMLVNVKAITEAVQEGFSYVLLQPVETIPAGTRVKIEIVEKSEEDEQLTLSLRSVEKILPRSEDDTAPDGEKKPAEPGKKEEGADADPPVPPVDPPKPDGDKPTDGEGKKTPDFLTAKLTLPEDELDLYFDPESEEEPDEEDEDDEDIFPPEDAVSPPGGGTPPPAEPPKQ